jgi:membrane-associated protease RseP (regulator of RpoE activity)
MSVLAAIGILALLIFVHELGHFLAARLQGIYANRFSIGFGPAIFRYEGKQTEYALRLIPLGGYVGFPDDDPDSTIPRNDPNLMRNRPVLDRAIVISAGVIFNLIFAFLILVTQIGVIGIPKGFNFQPGVIVPQVVSADSIAAKAGIQAGDVILQANDHIYGAEEASVQQLVDLIKGGADQELALRIVHGGEERSITLTPEKSENGVGRIGVQLAPNGKPIYRKATGPGEILALASKQFETIIVRTFMGFGQLVTNFGATASQMSGPVKIVEWGANIAQSDSGSLFFFAAFISINLAVMNILPLPALDGGQLAFLLIEGLSGKPLPAKFQDNVMQTGLVVLLGLGVFLIIRDTSQLSFVRQFFQ